MANLRPDPYTSPLTGIEVQHTARAALDGDYGSDTHTMAPPSPSLTSGSAIAVGSSADVEVIQSIEKGDFAPLDDDTRSLTDSIRQHIVDGGLRYHAYHAGKYCFPNDETEQYRDDLKHNLTVYLCDC